MAKAWITDRWVKDAKVAMPDGSVTRISPSSAQMKSLKNLPEHFRTSKFGKGSRWEAGWYDPDGVQKKRLFARRSDAEAFIAGIEDDIRADRYIDPSARERTFAAAAEAWLASKNRIKDSSWRRYRRELDNYVLPRWGTRAVGSITRPQIDEWISQLRSGTAVFEFDKNNHLTAEAGRRPVAMSAAYVRHVVGSTFGGALRYAVSEQWIGRNPLANVEFPRDDGDIENDLPSLSYVQLDILSGAVAATTRRATDGVLFDMLAHSGPRIGEATALKIKDLDLDQKRARIHRTWTVDRAGLRKLGPVKTWEKRWLPLADFVVDGLREITSGRDLDDFVFVTVRGAAVDGKNWYNRVWLKARRAVAAASGYSVHDLRHVAATNAIAAGADVKLVQLMLGHKDATETLNTYSHLWPNRVDEVIFAVEQRRAAALGRGQLREL